MNGARWELTLVYLTEAGPLDIIHDIEELADVDLLVEAGPDWNTLIEGRFVLKRRTHSAEYTFEKSEAQ